MTFSIPATEANDAVLAPERPPSGEDLLNAAGDAIAQKAQTPAQIEALLRLPVEQVYERLRQRAQEALAAFHEERKRTPTNHPNIKRLEEAAMPGRQRLIDEAMAAVAPLAQWCPHRNP